MAVTQVVFTNTLTETVFQIHLASNTLLKILAREPALQSIFARIAEDLPPLKVMMDKQTAGLLITESITFLTTTASQVLTK